MRLEIGTKDNLYVLLTNPDGNTNRKSPFCVYHNEKFFGLFSSRDAAVTAIESDMDKWKANPSQTLPGT